MKTITVESKDQELEVEFVLSWEEWAKADRIRCRRLRQKQGRTIYHRLLIAVPLLLAAGTSIVSYRFGISEGADRFALILMTLCALSMVIGTGLIIHMERLGLARSRNQRPVKQCWVASVRGLTRKTGGEVSEIPWTAIRRIERLGAMIGIFIDEMHYHLIPDRAFVTENQQVRFVRMMKSNLNSS